MTTPPTTSRKLRRSRARRGARLPVGLVALFAGLGLAAGLASAPPAVAGSQTQFSLVGRGWGHGIGMCQYGAYGYAKHGWLYKAILRHYYTGVDFGRVTGRSVRVMLNQSLPSVSVTSAGRFELTAGSRAVSIAGDATARITWSAGSYHLVVGTRSWDFGVPVTFVPGSAKLKLLNANQNGHVGRYRGTLRVIHYTNGFTVVNKLGLEKYLYGVVPRESPSSWPAEALKAQAVAARSFAARSLGRTGAFDVYCTTSSQVYGGFDGEAATTNSAVNKTAGVVPTYGGQPITAFFFSTSGGHTENVENVWGGTPVPYLKGVPDPYDGASPYHVWPENPSRRSAATLAAQLGAYSASNTSGVKGLLRTIYVVRRGSSPRVVKALVIGSDGVSEISGGKLRVELGLRDTWVSFTSLSIDPSQSTDKTITFGESTTVGGRRYPALADGAAVTLHLRPTGSGWSTRTIASSPHSQSLGGYTVRWSGYDATVQPSRGTEYYFTSGSGVSPHTIVSVRPNVGIAASTTTAAAGDPVAFTGTVKPALADKTVWLQVKDGDIWTDTISTTLNDDGSYRVEWTAAAGTSSLRLRVPKGDGLVQGTSPVVEVTSQAPAHVALPSVGLLGSARHASRSQAVAEATADPRDQAACSISHSRT